MKAIVTGGTGFIGSHLIERLRQKDYQIVCIAKDAMYSSVLADPHIEVISSNLNDPLPWKSILSKADYFYHLAGVTRAKTNNDYYEGNYLTTKNLIVHCRHYGKNLKRFLYVSSLAAAGPCDNGYPLDEQSPCNPISHYGKSKLLAEQEMIKLRGLIPFTIVRPSAVYGPRDRDMFKYISMINLHFQPLIGLKRKWLNLIYVKDLVEGIIQLTENPQATDEIFFLGNEKANSTQEIGDAISLALNCRRLKVTVPVAMVYGIGGLLEIIGKLTRQYVFFNIQKVREGCQISWDCSVEKVKSMIGFQPKISLVDGMFHTCQWYRENGWL